MIDTTAHSSIRYAFQNVQKSRCTMHDLLENLKNSVDFLFIQEAPIYFVRKVPSTTSETGDDLIGPIIHHDWQCIDKRSVHIDSQVAIYINKCLSSSYQLFPNFSPTLDPNVLILCVHHNLKRSNYFNLINIYNHPNTCHSAILSPASHLDLVPPPAYFGHANFSTLNAPSSWWCTPWALSWAPRRLFCATPFSDAFDSRRQTRSHHRPAQSSASMPRISQQVDCTPPPSWRH